MLSSVGTILTLSLIMKNRLINLQNVKSCVYVYFIFMFKKRCKASKILSLCVICQNKSSPNLAIFSICQIKSQPNIPFWPFAKFNPCQNFNPIKVASTPNYIYSKLGFLSLSSLYLKVHSIRVENLIFCPSGKRTETAVVQLWCTNHQAKGMQVNMISCNSLILILHFRIVTQLTFYFPEAMQHTHS